MNDLYFIAEVWGWSPTEVRDMPVSERKEFIRRKVAASEKKQLDALESMAKQGDKMADQKLPPPSKQEIEEKERKKKLEEYQKKQPPKVGPGAKQPPNDRGQRIAGQRSVNFNRRAPRR